MASRALWSVQTTATNTGTSLLSAFMLTVPTNTEVRLHSWWVSFEASVNCRVQLCEGTVGAGGTNCTIRRIAERSGSENLATHFGSDFARQPSWGTDPTNTVAEIFFDTYVTQSGIYVRYNPWETPEFKGGDNVIVAVTANTGVNHTAGFTFS